jgi:hypothetical protein
MEGFTILRSQELSATQELSAPADLGLGRQNLSRFPGYRFRPEGRYLIAWGPNGLPHPLWNYQGRRLDMYHNYSPSREMTGLGGTQ